MKKSINDKVIGDEQVLLKNTNEPFKFKSTKYQERKKYLNTIKPLNDFLKALEE